MSCDHCGHHKYCRNVSMVHILYKTVLMENISPKKLVVSGHKDHNLIRIFTAKYLNEEVNWNNIR